MTLRNADGEMGNGRKESWKKVINLASYHWRQLELSSPRALGNSEEQVSLRGKGASHRSGLVLLLLRARAPQHFLSVLWLQWPEKVLRRSPRGWVGSQAGV